MASEPNLPDVFDQNTIFPDSGFVPENVGQIGPRIHDWMTVACRLNEISSLAVMRMQHHDSPGFLTSGISGEIHYAGDS